MYTINVVPSGSAPPATAQAKAGTWDSVQGSTHSKGLRTSVTRKGNIMMRGLGLMRHKGCSAQSGSLSLEQTQHGRKGHCHHLQASDELWFDGRCILFRVPHMV